MTSQASRRPLAQRVPFYYGWAVLGATVSAMLVRPAMSAAVLSVFMPPMTREFGWSSSQFAGAISLGGLVAAALLPLIGPVLDRRGSRLIMGSTLLLEALAAFGLALINGPVAFYGAYMVGRMAFAGPTELAASTTVSNWFVHRRAKALAILQLAMGAGLTLLPLAAQLAINVSGWRLTWVYMGAAVLVFGVTPSLLFLLRRPEDVGLLPDGAATASSTELGVAAKPIPPQSEPEYTLRQAMRTKALWLLSAFTALIFMVQAGISLHQATHLQEQGMTPTQAAGVVSTFAAASALGGVVWAYLHKWLGIRGVLAGGAFSMSIGAIFIMQAPTLLMAGLGAMTFGAGLGGVSTMVRVAWADYYGRRSLGAIRGVTMPVQVAGQAVGPILAAALHDRTGNYGAAMAILSAVALGAGVLAFLANRPAARPDGSQEGEGTPKRAGL